MSYREDSDDRAADSMTEAIRDTMLSPAEIDLARRDAAIPGFATVLDPDAFLAALKLAAPASDVRAARIAYAKYRPERYCQASYRVDVGGAECDLDVRACRSEDVASWLEEEGGPAVTGPLGAGRMLLRDSAVLVTVFPNDPKLQQLSTLADPSGRVSLLRELLPDWPGIREGEIRCLRYWPGRRYSAELCASDGSRALLKAYTRKGYHRARRNAEAFRTSGPLRIARLLGYSDPHRLLAFEWLPGPMLSERCLGPEIDWEAVAFTGAALAALHGHPPDGLESWTRKDETAYLFSLSREIGFLCPRLSQRAATLAHRLAGWLASAPPVQLPVHGDFSDAQVLVDNRQVAIVDLDSACRGDPADDLGSLLAQWEIYQMRGKLSRGQLETMRDALLDGYHRSPIRSPAGRLGPYIASGLLRRGRFAFRARRPDWPQITEASIERAEAIMNASA
jgi:phosphotransferase family enzyme